VVGGGLWVGKAECGWGGAGPTAGCAQGYGQMASQLLTKQSRAEPR